MFKRLEIIVSGRVQGIGYRAYTVRTAEELQIKGSVINLPDGRVKIMAVAKEDDMNRFIDKLKKGPTFSLVRNVSIKEIETMEDYKDFHVEF